MTVKTYNSKGEHSGYLTQSYPTSQPDRFIVEYNLFDLNMKLIRTGLSVKVWNGKETIETYSEYNVDGRV